jgi:hypothetical protein
MIPYPVDEEKSNSLKFFNFCANSMILYKFLELCSLIIGMLNLR